EQRTGSLTIARKLLKPETTIVIAFTNTFSKESSGFQRSVDPIDGGEYLFTDFEPYYAHWLFPCFDQPDLKARYTVQVTAPVDWKVLHNEPALEAKVEDKLQTVVFKTTPLMSPYLFFLGAGPFEEWRDTYGDLPLVIYARKTLAPYMDEERLFETTKKGLKFFNDYFGTPYPYSQYGQIFIPEFAWGGMENPGAVALNERNIYRGAVTKSRLEGRDNLILHEMAHMWFGDLVTMEWWNDLWLNESFATYLASIAQDRAMGSEGTWMSFLSTKNWGYWQDQLLTTHPIETPVPDTRATKANFDGITYAKGASSLKQLHFFVGEEGFRLGLQDYFKKYAFKNTRREDFIQSIAVASKKDLTVWTKQWLQTAGPNPVKVSVTCTPEKKVTL
ncbi:MAG: M1 family metallopeptidase, partial [Bacteriovoracia bacterium]